MRAMFPWTTDRTLKRRVTLDIMTFGKIILLLIWPFIFLVILYFYDKEKFIRRLKQQLGIKDK